MSASPEVEAWESAGYLTMVFAPANASGEAALIELMKPLLDIACSNTNFRSCQASRYEGASPERHLHFQAGFILTARSL